MSVTRSLAALVIFTVAVSQTLLAQADDNKQGSLTVVHPWSRATAPSQKAGGVFLRIENASGLPDRLIGIETDMADTASLHAMIRDGDIMKMRPVEGGIEVPANGTVELAPGGMHVMLIGLREQLIKETTLPLTLIFDRAGRVEIQAVIESAGSRGPSGDAHGKHSRPATSGN